MKWLLLSILLIPAICFSQLRDYDKHYIAGVGIAAVTIPVAHRLGAKHPEGWCIVTGFVAGSGKELLDHYLHRRHPETETMHWDHISDWFATFTGAMTITMVVGPFLSRKRNNRYLLPEYH